MERATHMSSVWLEMFERQRAHWKTDSKRYTVTNPTEIHSILCLSIISEVIEVLDCISWKLHRARLNKPREELLEELIDIFKFWLCLVIHHGFDADDIVAMFRMKSDIVEERARNEDNDATT